MPSNISKGLATKVSQSKIYRDYEAAFSETTLLPLAFRPVDSWQPVFKGSKFQNPFCQILIATNEGCRLCLENQVKLSGSGEPNTRTAVCIAGLYDSAVPVKAGSETLGYLHTGQVALRKPTMAQFKKLTRRLLDWGVHTDLKRLEEAYFHTTVLSKRQYEAMLRLLEVFAQHLSMAADRIALSHGQPEPPMIARARRFIEERNDEQITLRDVARTVNASTFYFCKMFKKATGLTFTEYLSLVRISKAKNLLLNPNLRISEIAYQVGFESLTHFNRVFKKLNGVSPTEYRRNLPKTV
jgi:AraC-like DNA-binding protein/ligand-binding sensor protein